MATKLIILRGNSGSGKSTIAKALRNNYMGERTMLVQQDIVRREILHVEDKTGNPAVELIERLVKYGDEIQFNVILEGVLSNKKYGEMLQKLARSFSGQVFAFYLISHLKRL